MRSVESKWLRKTVALIVAMMLVFAVGACGTDNQQKSKDSASEKAKAANEDKPLDNGQSTSKEEKHDPVTITMSWQLPPENKEWTKMLDAFHERYPWITVKTISEWEGSKAVVKSIAANDPIDVFWDVQVDSVVDQNLAEDLTPFAEKDEEFKAYPYKKGYLDHFKRDGKLYALSRGNDGFFILYNKPLLKQYGLEVPKLDWTWEDFRTMAKKATDPSDKHYGVANWSWWYNTVAMTLPMANGHAANMAAMNEDWTKNLADGSVPEVLDDLNFFNDLMLKDGVMLNTKRAAEIGIEGTSFQGGLSLFFVAVAPQLLGFKTGFPFEWDIATMPRGTSKQVGFGWINPMFMAKASKHKEEAWLLMKFWDASKQGQKMLFDIGATFPNSDDPELVDYFINNSAVYDGLNRDVVRHTVAMSDYDPSSYMVGGADLRQIFADFSVKGWEEERSAHDYFPSVMQKFNEDLKKKLAKQK